MTGTTSGTGTAYPSEAPEFTPVVSGVRVIQSLALCVVLCRSLLVPLFFFFWPLCCLSFFDLWILINPLAFQTLSDIWTDTLDELYDFMEHVNSLYENIQVELQRIKCLGTLVINSSELYIKTLHKHACISICCD